jgi:hypothetical protein
MFKSLNGNQRRPALGFVLAVIGILLAALVVIASIAQGQSRPPIVIPPRAEQWLKLLPPCTRLLPAGTPCLYVSPPPVPACAPPAESPTGVPVLLVTKDALGNIIQTRPATVIFGTATVVGGGGARDGIRLVEVAINRDVVPVGQECDATFLPARETGHVIFTIVCVP